MGGVQIKIKHVNSSSVKEHRVPQNNVSIWEKEASHSTLLTNSQGPNRHLIHPDTHESTLNICMKRSGPHKNKLV